MKPCPDDRRRGEYLEAALESVRYKDLDVKKGGGYKYGFTLTKWRDSPADNSRYPGFYVYCSFHADRPDHRDILCFDIPNDWQFDGDTTTLRVRMVPSYWRPESHYYLELLTANGNLVDPSISKFKPEVGDQIIGVFQALDRAPAEGLAKL